MCPSIVTCATKRTTGFGFTIIEKLPKTRECFPLCEDCRAKDDVNDLVFRKYVDTPELKVTDGGELSDEQMLALAEKYNREGTEH